MYQNAKFLPNAEADEVEPGEQIVASHKDSDVGHSNVLEKGNRPRLNMPVPFKMTSLTVAFSGDCTLMAPTIVVVSAEL